MEIHDLSQQREFDGEGYVSKLLHDSDGLRVALFCLEPQQEVPSHVSPSEVLFYVIEGQGRVGLGADEGAVAMGSLVACPPGIPHRLKADTRLVVLATIAARPG